jgi:type III pantothenate kinase
VERFLGQVGPLLGESSRLLLAGGDAAALQALLPVPSLLVPDGVLRGLAAWGSTSSGTGGDA